MGKSHSKQSSGSYTTTKTSTMTKPTAKSMTSSKSTTKSTPPSIISTSSRSNSFLNKRISSFSMRSSSHQLLRSTPPSSIPTTPTPFSDCSDYNLNGNSNSNNSNNNNNNNNNNDSNLSNHTHPLSESPSSEYKYIHGRRFHNVDSVKYSLPNDEAEMDRLKSQHYLFNYIFQGNFSSPVKEILKVGGTEVLDLGCGPGTWLL